MPSTRTRILTIGKGRPPTNAILERLAHRGWGFRAVETLGEAEDLMRTFAFDIVLAAESLPDGRGYELAGIVVRRGGTLLVAVALSESCLWLPVVELGEKVLGNRALNADALAAEAEKLLSARDRNGARETRPMPLSEGPGPHRATPPRRKDTALA